MLYALLVGLGLLLLAGLWTPIAGALVAGCSFSSAVAQPADRWYTLIAGVLGVAFALQGPGAWSVDARLFGWKRLEIRGPKKQVPPPF